MTNARVLFCGVLVGLMIIPHATMATTRKVPHALTVVDAGALTIQSANDALVRGEGFAKEGVGLNTRVESQGQLVLPGAVATCANSANSATGWVAQAAVVESDGADTVRYLLDMRLCPTGTTAGVYAASGTYTITGGSGKYQDATGVGIVEGVEDLVAATYQMLIVGSITY